MDFRVMYFKLFAAMADAAELLENGENKKAYNKLVKTMQEAETIYMSFEEEEDEKNN